MNGWQKWTPAANVQHAGGGGGGMRTAGVIMWGKQHICRTAAKFASIYNDINRALKRLPKAKHLLSILVSPPPGPKLTNLRKTNVESTLHKHRIRTGRFLNHLPIL